MSRDGSGNYTLPAGNPVVTGTTISSTVQNNTMNDVAAALTASIANDGQTTPTADLKMGGFKHKNVGNAATRISPNANYASAADVQDGTITYLTGVAGTNTITASAPLGLAAYVTGQRFVFVPAVINTGATTLNVNAIGAKNVFSNGQACGGNELIALQPVEVEYDGTQFNVLAGSSAFVDTYLRIKGSADATKQVRFEVDGLTTGTTRTLTPQDASGTLALITEFAYLGLPSSSGRLLLPNDYLTGFALTNNGATGFDVAAGQAMDSTNVSNIIGSAIANKTQAAWTAGAAAGGKLHVAAMANNAWYYWFALWKTADGTVDYGFDVATTPTLPGGYTKYRYIGARKTQFASTNWDTFIQHGDEVLWNTPPALDFNGAMTAANRVLTTMNVPAIKVKWFGQAQLNNTPSTASVFFLTDPAIADTAPTVSATPLGSGGSSLGAVGGNVQTVSQVSCWTNTSSQIGVRGNGLQTLILQTLGWIDQRGKPV